MSESVVISKSLESSEVHRLLAKFYRSRVANGILHHSIIFPKSSIAFMIQPICELCTIWPPSGKYFLDKKLIDRIDQFLRIHRTSYVFLSAAKFEDSEYTVVNSIEHMYRDNKVLFIPVEGASACVNVIMQILKPQVELLSSIKEAMKLVNGELDEARACAMLENNLKLSSHDAMVVQDGCSTMTQVAVASIEQLKECSLSQHTSQTVFNFFRADWKK